LEFTPKLPTVILCWWIKLEHNNYLLGVLDLDLDLDLVLDLDIVLDLDLVLDRDLLPG
jgi:hypothetical protein